MGRSPLRDRKKVSTLGSHFSPRKDHLVFADTPSERKFRRFIEVVVAISSSEPRADLIEISPRQLSHRTELTLPVVYKYIRLINEISKLIRSVFIEVGANSGGGTRLYIHRGVKLVPLREEALIQVAADSAARVVRLE